MLMKDGETQIELPNFALWIKQNPRYAKHLQDGFIEYKKLLVKVLTNLDGTPNIQRLYAFKQKMMEYKTDINSRYAASEVLVSPYDMAVGTLDGVDGDPHLSKFQGDCEDQAFFLQSILEMAGRTSVKVMGVPMHAEAVFFYQDEANQFHVMNLGAAGSNLYFDGKRLGRNDVYLPENSTGFGTMKEALASLSVVWDVKQSGSYHLRDGSLISPPDDDSASEHVTILGKAVSMQELKAKLGNDLKVKEHKIQMGKHAYATKFESKKGDALVSTDQYGKPIFDGRWHFVYTYKTPDDLNPEKL
jgi:hypothetical protein